MWWPFNRKPLVCQATSNQVTVVPQVDSKDAPKLLDLNSIEFVKSPNYGKRADVVRCIVLHHTGSTGMNGTVSWLCNPAAQASAHYVIGFDGTIKQLVKLENASYNAGKSAWKIDGKDIVGLNSCSIGIEILNIGVLQKGADGKYYYDDASGTKKEWKGDQPVPAKIVYPNGQELSGYGVRYPEKQVQAVIDLCRALVAKYPSICKEDILTHFQVAQPLGRKNDPFGLDIEYLKQKIFE